MYDPKILCNNTALQAYRYMIIEASKGLQNSQQDQSNNYLMIPLIYTT